MSQDRGYVVGHAVSMILSLEKEFIRTQQTSIFRVHNFYHYSKINPSTTRHGQEGTRFINQEQTRVAQRLASRGQRQRNCSQSASRTQRTTHHHARGLVTRLGPFTISLLQPAGEQGNCCSAGHASSSKFRSYNKGSQGGGG